MKSVNSRLDQLEQAHDPAAAAWLEERMAQKREWEKHFDHEGFRRLLDAMLMCNARPSFDTPIERVREVVSEWVRGWCVGPQMIGNEKSEDEILAMIEETTEDIASRDRAAWLHAFELSGLNPRRECDRQT
jgi:hypothetical protein